jgi:hypothetical protein
MNFIPVFDCLHEIANPVGTPAHIDDALAADGIWMIVEPFANNSVEENFAP